MEIVIKVKTEQSKLVIVDSPDSSAYFVLALSPVTVMVEGEDITSKVSGPIDDAWIHSISCDILRGGFLETDVENGSDPFDVNIEVECDEFDPAKVTLLKSCSGNDGEFEDIPSGVLVNAIMYDGEVIYWHNIYGF